MTANDRALVPWKPFFLTAWCLCAVLLAMSGCTRDTPDPSDSNPPQVEATPTVSTEAEQQEQPTVDQEEAGSAPPTTTSSATEPRAESYLPLVGRWVRTDSPYVIEIRGVGRDGNMEAAYFNPRPINVSRAMARRESGELQVFVELRDVNYPGATYNLAYNRSQDALQGIYFQPALGQGFDVSFARVTADSVAP